MTSINSIDDTQDAILEFLRDELAQPVYEEGIPTGTTVKRDSKGQVNPYVVVQFGDTYARGGKTFNGQRTYDYSLPIATQVVSPDPTIGRKLSNRLMDVLLGAQFDHAPGGVNKVPVGGAITTIAQSDAATQAYMVPAWFRVTIQYVEGGTSP